MSARAPRRSFAAPFVVTLAACSGSSRVPVHDNPPPPHPENPPAPTPTPEPTPTPTPSPDPSAGGAPGPAEPVDKSASPKVEPMKFDRRWTIMHVKNKPSCEAIQAADCPKGKPGEPMPTCNPPAPTKYACPDGLAEGDSLNIILRAGATECFVDFGPIKCPPNASCNPPRPRKLPCP